MTASARRTRSHRRAIEIVTTRVYVTVCGTNEKRDRIDLAVVLLLRIIIVSIHKRTDTASQGDCSSCSKT